MAILENKSVTAVLDMLCMSGRSSAINTIELTHVLDICSSHIAHTQNHIVCIWCTYDPICVPHGHHIEQPYGTHRYTPYGQPICTPHAPNKVHTLNHIVCVWYAYGIHMSPYGCHIHTILANHMVYTCTFHMGSPYAYHMYAVWYTHDLIWIPHGHHIDLPYGIHLYIPYGLPICIPYESHMVHIQNHTVCIQNT